MLQGTAASKKKKKAKLQRVMATVKRAARKGEADPAQSFAAIQLLRDPQVSDVHTLHPHVHFTSSKLQCCVQSSILCHTTTSDMPGV